MLRTILLLALAFSATALSAQSQLGWRPDRYAGINGSLLNPAFPLHTPYAWDVNLMEGAAFIANNYAFVRNASARQILRADEKTTFVSAPDLAGDAPQPNELVVDYFRGNQPRFAAVQSAVMGPSFSLRLAPRTRIGLFTAARSWVSARQIDTDLSYYAINNLPINTSINIDPFRLNAAAWAEVGLSLAQGFEVGANGTLGLGFNLRRLWGYEAGYLSNERTFAYTRLSDVLVTGQAPAFDFGFTDAWINTPDNYQPNTNGRGWGLDLGLTYAADDGQGGYYWRIGATLLDLGGIRFNTNAQAHFIALDSLASLRTDRYERYDNVQDVDDFIQQFSADLLADSLASRTANSFRIGLPSALSLQADVALAPDLFISAVWVGNIASSAAALQRGALLSIAPRWERHWWGIAAPLSLYEWRQLRVGLALRLGPLTLGSDHLGAWLGQQRLSGADFYAAVKIFPWGLSTNANNPKNRNAARRRGREVECFTF